MSRSRTSRKAAGVAVVAIVIALGFAYANRVAIKDAYHRLSAPPLPVEEAYIPVVTTTPPVVKEVPPPVTPPKPPEPPTPIVIAPVATTTPNTTIPAEKRLSVPFMSQAPFANWDPLHEEACEEAAVLMVRGYYQGRSGRYDPKEAEELIQNIVTFQKSHYGFFESTSATETKRFIEAVYPELSAEVVPLDGPGSVIKYIAQGIPVILPADGKTLPNPNFRNGGPKYHMLVVRGYTKDRFITNDPGTRNGENFTYTYDGLLDAVHDWNNGDVPHGRRVMIIVRLK